MANESSGANRPEILAPVGNAEMLRAAVFAGADAVYLGLHQFNARRTAGNFDAAALREAAAFCRARDVNVYVTMNTTLAPQELPAVGNAIRAAAAAGADALIVQDLAVAALAREIAPQLALHGSTQMSVHSLEGALQAAEMGFSRVILARELSLKEIADITARCPIETEVFIHGALCMSVSGQCYLSAFLGGRSGNRGACAGPCRLPFSAGEPGACHLSLKDHSHIAYLPQLADAGVASVKIEGRLRSPEYVAAAVSACAAARSGRPYDEQILQNVFSRSGFTDGYITGRRDGRMFGVRTEADAAKARQAEPRLRELFRREYGRVPVDMTLELGADGARLIVRDRQGHEVCVSGSTPPQPAQSDPFAAYERALGKTGGTPFVLGRLSIRPEGPPLFVPAGELNALRRQALEHLLTLREAARPAVLHPDVYEDPEPRMPGNKRFAVRLDGIAQLPSAWERELPGAVERLLLPLADWQAVPPGLRPRVWLELPRAEFGAQEGAVRAAVEASGDQGFQGYVAQNLAHVHLLRGRRIMGGFGLNVTNPLAAEEYEALGLGVLTVSPETPCGEMAAVAGAARLAALIYGHMPLMLTRACPLQNVRTCKGCSRQGELVDRKNMRFPVRCTGPQGVRTIYNPVPLYAADRTREIPADLLMLYFTIETPQRVEQVLELALGARPFDGPLTRGLLFKSREDVTT